jgi:hypothetical protein
MRHILSIIIAIPGFLLLVVTVSRARLPYNSEGRYFDASEGVVYHSQAVIIYGLMSALALAISIALFMLVAKKQTR